MPMSAEPVNLDSETAVAADTADTSRGPRRKLAGWSALLFAAAFVSLASYDLSRASDLDMGRASLAAGDLQAALGRLSPHLFSGVFVPESPIPRGDDVLARFGPEALQSAMAALASRGELVLDSSAEPPEAAESAEGAVLGLLSDRSPPALRPYRALVVYTLRLALAFRADEPLSDVLVTFARSHLALYLWARTAAPNRAPHPSEAPVCEAFATRLEQSLGNARVVELTLLAGALVLAFGWWRLRMGPTEIPS
jgi:hypothetical protein